MSDSLGAAKGVHLLRRQRHSFLNHLQVISGWLQLEKPERARQYVESIASRMTGESEALRNASPELALLMLDLGLEAETYGAQLRWRIADPSAMRGEAELQQLHQEVLAALRQAAQGGEIAIELGAHQFSIVHSPPGQGKG